MTTCTERWREPLLDHAAGAPPGVAFARHLAGCAVCCAALYEGRQRMAEIDTGLHRLATIEPSPQAISRAISAVRGTERGTRPVGRQWAAVAWSALAAMLIVTLGYVFKAQEQQRRALSAAAALNLWRSPTEELLQSPTGRSLSTPPALGAYFYRLDDQHHKKGRKTP